MKSKTIELKKAVKVKAAKVSVKKNIEPIKAAAAVKVKAAKVSFKKMIKIKKHFLKGNQLNAEFAKLSFNKDTNVVFVDLFDIEELLIGNIQMQICNEDLADLESESAIFELVLNNLEIVYEAISE